MKRKIFKLLGVIGIVAVVFIGSGMLPVNVEIAAASPVAVIEAEQAALNHIEKKIGKIPEWESATISSPVLYYAPDMTLSAYEFTVKNGGEDVGFIIVSARKDWMPVLEYGSGNASSSYITDNIQIALDAGYINEDDESKPTLYYWGACTCSMQIGEKMRKDRIVINLATGRQEILPKETPVLQMDSNKAKVAWAEISDSIKNNSIMFKIVSYFSPLSVMAAVDNTVIERRNITGSLTAVTISEVPLFYQSGLSIFHGDDQDPDADGYPDCVGNPDDLWGTYDGCANIAGAMVIAYWHTQGYTSIPNPAYQETEEILIDHCHYMMQTTDYGITIFYYMADGMEAVTDNIYGYDFNSYEEFDPPWWRVTSNIDDGKPFILTMSGPIIGHSVCVYGYEDDGEDSIRVYYTTNTDRTYYIAWGDWTYSTMSTIYP
jgi:hypothetical protein